MANVFEPKAPAKSDANARFDPAARMTHDICVRMRNTFAGEPDIAIASNNAMVTVAQGKRAVQIQAIGEDRFLISFRRRQTFHMHSSPVTTVAMIDLAEGFMREQ